VGQKADSFKVVYNSDLIIRDKSEAATLCLFYDHVFLPYVSDSTALVGVNEANSLTHNTHHFAQDIKQWELEYGTLFDEKVLVRMPQSTEVHQTCVDIFKKPQDILADDIFVHRFENHIPPAFQIFQGSCHSEDLTIVPWGEPQLGDEIVDSEDVSLFDSSSNCTRWVKHFRVSRWVTRDGEQSILIQPNTVPSILLMPVERLETGVTKLVRNDLVMHLLRTDIDMPQIFTTLKGRPGRDVLVALEAEATFSYLLPKLSVYHPSQILDLRAKIADTREGFTMHLWKLSKGLEEHAKEDVPVTEMARFANDLIETELIPDFREFRRQLDAMKAGNWNKVLDAAGKIVEIDAAPWTPKFWGLLLKALGITLITSAAGQQESLSNKYQAFKLMSDLESAASRFTV
jgi:hypothetical protein